MTTECLPSLQGENGEDGLEGVDGEQVRMSTLKYLVCSFSLKKVIRETKASSNILLFSKCISLNESVFNYINLIFSVASK